MMLIALNDGESSQAFDIIFNGQTARPRLKAGSAEGFAW
jgi:hypothetical protein